MRTESSICPLHAMRITYVVGLLLALLSTTTKAEHQMKSRLLLDVVVTESATILELLARKDQTLLVGRNAKISISSLEAFSR